MLRVLAFFVAVMLAGCTSIPLRSLPDLSRIDFMTTDVNVLRVAIQMPTPMRPRPRGVEMGAVVNIQGVESRTSFLMVPDESASAHRELDAEPAAGMGTYVYRLSTPDIEHFDALRKQVAESKKQGRHGSFGLGIETKEFCLDGPIPKGDLLISTYVLTSETRRFVLLISEHDLRRDKKMAAALGTIGGC